MTAKSKNLLLEKPEYKITDSGSGVLKEFMYEHGGTYREFTSYATLFGMPLISIVNGINPETGKRGVAKGFIAIGGKAKGVIAIGQFANGWFTLAQIGTARIFGLGQMMIAPLAIGQLAIAAAAIGQIGLVGVGIFQTAVTLFGGISMQDNMLMVNVFKGVTEGVWTGGF